MYFINSGIKSENLETRGHPECINLEEKLFLNSMNLKLQAKIFQTDLLTKNNVVTLEYINCLYIIELFNRSTTPRIRNIMIVELRKIIIKYKTMTFQVCDSRSNNEVEH